MSKKRDLNEQLQEIIAAAEKAGAEANVFYLTTLKRYQMQIKIMEGLQGKIDELGSTIEKEYVRGKANICINPAITEYNKTATAANNTVQTLMKIVQHAGQTSIAEVSEGANIEM